MRLNRTPVAFALMAAAVVGLAAAIAAQGTSKVPGNIWPPAKKQMEKSIALSPEEEMKTFSMPPGYRVELVAAEPMIESPILIDFDADGRLWVIEMPAFLPDMSGPGLAASRSTASSCSRTPTTTARWTSGRCSPTSWCMPRALKVLDRGVLIGEPPNLWLMKDTNGDLKADTKEIVVNTYGTAAAASSTTPTACSGRWTTSCTRPSTPGTCAWRRRQVRVPAGAQPRPVADLAG